MFVLFFDFFEIFYIVVCCFVEVMNVDCVSIVFSFDGDQFEIGFVVVTSDDCVIVNL